MEFSKYSSKKDIFLFDSFGFRGLKEFIIQDDRNITDKIMYNLKKFNSVDKEMMLILVKISIKNIIDLFHAINKFVKKHEIDDEITII